MFSKIKHWVMSNLKKEFTSGLLFLVPLLAAFVIILWLFNTLDGFLQPIINLIFGREIAGLGIAATVTLIWATGLVLHNYLGRAVLRSIDKGLERVPIFSQVYSGSKQVMQSLGGVKTSAFREAVLVDFPQKGVKSLAFITNELVDEGGEKVYVIYVPGSPNPTSGFLQLLRENQIVRQNMGVDCAMRMIVSCGMVTPDKCRTFELADGYRGSLSEIVPASESEMTSAMPITLTEVEKLKVSSCQAEGPERTNDTPVDQPLSV